MTISPYCSVTQHANVTLSYNSTVSCIRYYCVPGFTVLYTKLFYCFGHAAVVHDPFPAGQQSVRIGNA